MNGNERKWTRHAWIPLILNSFWTGMNMPEFACQMLFLRIVKREQQPDDMRSLKYWRQHWQHWTTCIFVNANGRKLSVNYREIIYCRTTSGRCVLCVRWVLVTVHQRGVRVVESEQVTFYKPFPLKKKRFLYLDWLIVRDFYVNLHQKSAKIDCTSAKHPNTFDVSALGLHNLCIGIKQYSKWDTL